MQLDSEIEHYANRTKAISERYIIAEHQYQSSPLKLFDRKSGKFITQIGNKGRGNGEYSYVESCRIDEKEETILLFCALGSGMEISIYGFDGKFQRNLPLTESNLKIISSFSPDEDGNFTILSYDKEDEESKFRLVRQTYQGEEIQKVDIEAEEWVRSMDIVSYGDGYITYKTVNREGEKVGLHRYDFKENSVKLCFSVDCNYKTGGENGNPITFDYVELQKRYFAVRYDIEEYKNGEYVGYMMAPRDLLMVNKKGLTGGRVRFENDIFGYNIRFGSFLYSCKDAPGYYSYTIDAIKLVEALEKLKTERTEELSDKLSARIDELMNAIDIEGNSVIIYGKIK